MRLQNQVLFTDLPKLICGNFLPARGNNLGWTTVPYEHQDFSGVALSTGAHAPFRELALDLKLTGEYDLYAAIPRSQTRFRVDGMEGYFQFFPEHGGTGCNIQEVHLGHFDMTGKKLHISRTNPPEVTHYRGTWGAGIFYIRAVPANKPKFNKNMVATNDGWSFFALKGFAGLETIQAQFEPLAQSDVFRMLYSPGNADCTMNPFAKVAAPLTSDLAWGYRDCDIRAQQALIKMRALGIDPIAEAVRCCRRIGLEFHFYVRVQGYQAAYPWTGVFDSATFMEHPQWRCIDEEGEPIAFLSWANPEAQDHLMAYFEELLNYEPDGICLALNRGMPLMVCEPPVIDAYKKKYGRAPNLPQECDSPEMNTVRQEIFTAFVMRLYKLLLSKKKHLSFIIPSTIPKLQAAGVDIKGLVDKGIVQALYIPGDAHECPDLKAMQASGKTKVYPNGNLWDKTYDPQNLAKDALTKIHDAGFAGGYIWDIEALFENPYNWFFLKHLGSPDYLRELAAGKITPPKIDRLKRVGGIKITRYNPNVGY
jgi:hypothetical protein